MTDEDLVDLLDVRIDHRLLDLDWGTRIEFPGEEAGIETAEPWIEKNGLVSERDLPTVGAEPGHLDAGRPRATATRWHLGALGDSREQQRSAPVDSGRSHTSGEAAPEKRPT
jgi:hypothetical protein